MPAKKAEPTRQLTEADLKRIPWRSIGPAVMGGRVADMCFAPGNPKAYLVAYATGGLWKTENLGTTFSPIFDDQETSSIGAVAWCDAPKGWKGADANASDSKAKKGDQSGTEKPKVKEEKGKNEGKGQIIWVGTGEGNGRNSSSWGNGVYRSTNGGAKWEHLGLEDSHDIPRIAVDPKDPDTCYVAALGHLWGHNPTRGLYKTTDGGKTWDRILEMGDDCGACDVILDPKDPNTVYAAMYMRLRTPYSYMSGGPKGGIFKSTDGGKTWKQLTKGLPKQTGRIGIDIFAGDHQKLIAVVESTEEGANSIRDDRMRGGGVFRSDDGGETWRRLSVRSPRAFYFSKIKFDPKDDNRVYMLGWTTEVSDDGGETFRQGLCDICHADHHAILINPNDSDHVILGTDGGVYQSFDKCKTWDFLNTMATGQFYNIALDDSDPYRIIGGLQDNGTWVGPSATGKNNKKEEQLGTPDTGITNADWLDVYWGDGFHCEFDRFDKDVVYAEWQGGHFSRINMRTGEKRYFSPEAREGEPRHRYNWNSPFIVSHHDPSTTYHGGNYVFKINNQNGAWKRISGDLTTADPLKMETEGSNAETYCTVVTLSESPMAKGLLWAGSDDGLIHVTQNEGGSWANVTPAEVAGRYVSRVHASAHVKGRCYASIDGHRTHDYDPCILVTEDFGASWKDITSDLPKNRAVKVVREDKFNPDVLYCGTEKGFYVSLNRGESWVKFHGKGFPTVPVDDIQQHSRETDLVLGTHGRSIWVLDDAHWLSEATASVLEKGLHLFSLRPGRNRWFMEYPGMWTHKVFRAANPALGLRIDYWVKEYTGEDVSIQILDSKGVVLKKLGGSNAAGYSRVVWDLVPDEWHQLLDKNEEDPMFNKFFVRPGTYKVKLKMGDFEEVGEFEVLAPPL